MNRRLAILLIAAFAAGCASGHELATTEAGGIDWGWTEICPGAEVGRASVNLFGGGSSTIWTEKTGVLNHPSDNHRFDHFGQRIVPNVIYIRDKAKNAIDACSKHF